MTGNSTASPEIPSFTHQLCSLDPQPRDGGLVLGYVLEDVERSDEIERVAERDRARVGLEQFNRRWKPGTRERKTSRVNVHADDAGPGA